MVQHQQNDLSQLAFIKKLNSWTRKAAETPPCFPDRYSFGRIIRQGWALRETVHVNYQIDVSIDKQVAQQFQNAYGEKMVGYKRFACPLQITVLILPKSRDTNVKLLSNDRSTNTFQVVYHSAKTFQIGSITFHLAVPKLSKFVNGFYTENSAEISQQCKKVRKTSNSVNKCGLRKMAKSVEKCGEQQKVRFRTHRT